MLERARRDNGSEKITYLCMPIEDTDFPPASFDVVLSFLALHYIESFGDICEKVHRILVSGGTFVFSVEHPVFTAQETEDWYYGDDGSILHWPVNHYFTEVRRDTKFPGEQGLKYTEHDLYKYAPSGRVRAEGDCGTKAGCRDARCPRYEG